MSIYLQSLIVVLIIFTVVYLIAQVLKNNSIIDIFWGLSYIILSAYYFLQNISFYSAIVLGMVALWGFRLSYYILKRNKKVEDFRYKNWRETWGSYFALKAFFRIFMLQALIMYTISLTLTYIFNNNMGILSLFVIGFAIWVSGYILEVVSDKQMRDFKKKNKGLINVGLWKLSRHPNYFGEIVMWIGFFIVSLAFGAPIWLVVSPLLMYSIFEFISIPVLEKKYDDREEYQEYKKNTNKLIPIRRG